MRTLLFAIYSITSLALLLELPLAFLGYPFISNSPLVFVFSAIAISGFAVTSYVTRSVDLGTTGTVYFNKLKPYLSPTAYTALNACFAFCTVVFLSLILGANSFSVNPLLAFVPVALMFASSTAIVVRWFHAP